VVVSGAQKSVTWSLPVHPSQRWYRVAGHVACSMIALRSPVVSLFSLSRQINDLQRLTPVTPAAS